MQAVTCPTCGASTPVPNDLLTPGFPCSACGRELRTEGVVGAPVTNAERFVRSMQDVVAGRAEKPEGSPGDHAAAPPRPSKCIFCQAAVEVPMALRVHELSCPACGKVQAVAAHVSDAERLRVDMEMQIAQNQAVKDLRAQGVPCPRCGAHNEVPETGVQAVCRFCGAAILLGAVVGQDALARERLGKGVRQAIAEARQQQEVRERRTNVIVLGIVFGFLGLVICGAALSSLVGAVVAALGR